jgi:hypothetical protein
MIRSICVLGIVVTFIGCGAGLPEETTPVTDGSTPGCSLSGGPLEFNMDNVGGTLFWATDSRIQLPRDRALAKLLFDVPDSQLPNGVTSAQIQVVPVPSSSLPAGGHADTAFQVTAITPAEMTGFAGSSGSPDTPTLTIRYDPVACEISSDIESQLVLGRLNANLQWQEVCGTTATIGDSIHEVSCSEGDLSFGVFGVILKGAASNDQTPPFFTPVNRGGISLTSLNYRPDAIPPFITLQWGAASDGAGSGVKGYWVYVDGLKNVFAAASSLSGSNPVQYQFVATGGLNISQSHRYQVTAVDNVDNESALFGFLQLP